MSNQSGDFHKHIALRSVPGIAGIACLVIAFGMTALTHVMFTVLVAEGVVLIGLTALLLRKYLKTPVE